MHVVAVLDATTFSGVGAQVQILNHLASFGQILNTQAHYRPAARKNLPAA